MYFHNKMACGLGGNWKVFCSPIFIVFAVKDYSLGSIAKEVSRMALK